MDTHTHINDGNTNQWEWMYYKEAIQLYVKNKTKQNFISTKSMGNLFRLKLIMNQNKQ